MLLENKLIVYIIKKKVLKQIFIEKVIVNNIYLIEI